MDDNYTDLVPVKDMKGNLGGAGEASRPLLTQDRQLAGEKRAIMVMARGDLEDAYLRLHDEHMLLKKHALKQEEKIKKLATKLSRIIKDKKSEHDIPTEFLSSQAIGAKGKEVELQEKIDDLTDKVHELEKLNSHLKDKLALTKQQIPSTPKIKKPNNYSNISAKVKTGIYNTPSLTSQPASGKAPQRKRPQSCNPNFAVQLVEEARNEITQLEDLVSKQSTQIEDYQQQVNALNEKIHQMELEHEEAMLALKEKSMDEQKKKTQDNCELISLHRELSNKAAEISSMQANAAEAEQNYKALKTAHDHLVSQLNDLHQKLQEEQNHNFDLQTELRKTSAANKRVLELQEQVRYLREEIGVLEETNARLMDAPLDQERILKKRLAQLEATLQSERLENSSLSEQLDVEKRNHKKTEKIYLSLQKNYSSMKDELSSLKKKLEEQPKHEMQTTEVQTVQENELDFLNKVPPDDEPASQQLRKVATQLSETQAELYKVHNMLTLQYKINQDFEAEMTALKADHELKINEYQARLQEYAEHLDMRAAIIQKLEKQLKDIAYGTPAKIDTRLRDNGEDTLNIPRGQNLLEIHFDKATINSKGLEIMKEHQPLAFLTWCFYEFELQSTPVLRGPKPEYNTTSQYKVIVDDFFLHYLEKEQMVVELHQALGLDYKTIGRGTMEFKDLIHRPHGTQIHGKVNLNGFDQGNVQVGVVEYWLRLHMPMEQAVRLYKEKAKAMSYLENNQLEARRQTMSQQTGPSIGSNSNILHIKIIQCTGLPCNKNGDAPSAYCMYKLYDLADQDTSIVPFSCNPQFNDHRTFPLMMDVDLDSYLRNWMLEIYVFDDTETEEATYIGRATIPLLPLAQSKQLAGNFGLFQLNGKPSGYIEASIYWESSYVAPKQTLEFPHPKEMKDPDVILPCTSDIPRLHSSKLPRVTSLEHTPVASKSGKGQKPPRISGSKTRGSGKSHLKLIKEKPKSAIPLVSSENIKFEGSKSTLLKSRTSLLTSPKKLEELFSTSDAHSGSKINSQPLSSSEQFTIDHSSTLSEAPIPAPRKIKSSERKLTAMQPSEGPDVPSHSPSNEEPEGPEKQDHSEKVPSGWESNEDTAVEYSSPEPADDPVIKPEDEPVIEPEDKLLNDFKDEEKSLPEEEEDSQNYFDEESDDEVIVADTAFAQKSEMAGEHLVVIAVNQLRFIPEAALLQDSSINMLYVEYQFLDWPPEELETPFSLPKPQPPSYVVFNFRKVFNFDPEISQMKRDRLKEMLLSEEEGASNIVFTVVSEPNEEDSNQECEEVGHAFVDLKGILNSKQDLVDKYIPLIADGLLIGELQVTIQAYSLLQNLVNNDT